MATVFIPAQWQKLTGGRKQVELQGQSLRQVIAALESAFPDLAGRLSAGGALVPGMAVSIDGAFTSKGLLAPVGPRSEVHFLPAIGGG
jgi:molybdopterin synthase sulfur carrier subunit